MKDEFNNLDTDESLVMYLAGELPDVQRSQLERDLAGSASLRARLEDLRTAHRLIEAEIAAGPRAEIAASSSTMRTIRAMRQWQTEQLARPASLPNGKQFKMPSWGLPAAVAAAVLIGFVIWWGNQQSSSNDPVNIAQNSNRQETPEGVPEGVALAVADPSGEDILPSLGDESGGELANVESQLDALSFFAEQMR